MSDPSRPGCLPSEAAALATAPRPECSPEEWAVRVDLAAAYRLVALHGWDDLIDVDANKVADSPYPVKPAGFTIHSAVHMHREDAHCVVHHTVQGQDLDERERIVRDLGDRSDLPLVGRSLAWPTLLRRLDRTDPSYRD